MHCRPRWELSVLFFVPAAAVLAIVLALVLVLAVCLAIAALMIPVLVMCGIFVRCSWSSVRRPGFVLRAHGVLFFGVR